MLDDLRHDRVSLGEKLDIITIREGRITMDNIDLIFTICAVLFNLLIAGIFVAQKHEKERLVRIFGISWLCLVFPLAAVFVTYLRGERNEGATISFIFILLYMFVELLLDYILKVDFRSQARTHVPYIMLEYLALFSLIWLAFLIDPVVGYIVSICFWLLMGSLIYLYWDKIMAKVIENDKRD